MPTKTILILAGSLIVIIFLFIITRRKDNDRSGVGTFFNLGLLAAIIFGAIKLFGKKEEESEDAKFIREEMEERTKKIQDLKAQGESVVLDIDRDTSKVEKTSKDIEALEEEKLAIKEPPKTEKKTVSEAAKKLKGL